MIKIEQLSIIIPNYNGEKFLINCLESTITALTKANMNNNVEIILVDNNSKDKSIRIFKQLLEQSNIKNKIIQNPINFGFAKAVNLGIMGSKYDWVLLLNNDITFHPNWFMKIFSETQKINISNLAVIFGTVLNKHGDKIESQGIQYFSQGKAKNINNGMVFKPSTINSHPTTVVWGASAALVIYNKTVIKKIGLFDEDFFAYEEDIDLALRLNKLNYKTLYIPSAISYHLGGATSNTMGNLRNRMDAKNWIYIIIKNYTKKEILNNLFPLIIERGRNLSGLIKETLKIYKVKSIYYLPTSLFKTYSEVVFKLPKMIKKRRQLQKLLQFYQYQ